MFLYLCLVCVLVAELFLAFRFFLRLAITSAGRMQTLGLSPPQFLSLSSHGVFTHQQSHERHRSIQWATARKGRGVAVAVA